ncbi:MAG: hypothetical protein DRJ01_03325 [Bacteroidetes bacterium]|nr:MAG: hypothetical protein DRJ01_03325 [Bacteroidota bacterium]
MKFTYRLKNTKEENENLKLPKGLSYYKDSDFSTKLRARFMYYLCFSVIIALIFLVFNTSYLHLNSKEFHGIFYPVIILEMLLILVLGICIFILKKGHYNIVKHIFISSSMLCVWAVMWVSIGNPLVRLDTVVYILAVFNLSSLFFVKHKRVYLLYIIINVIVLFVFVFFVKEDLSLTSSTVIDYLADTTVAFLFTGIVGYNIIAINKRSFEKVETDNKQLKKTEEALRQSELFRHRVFDSSNIPIVVMESKSYKYIDINKAALKIYGFSSREESLGKTPLDVSAPTQYDGSPSFKKAAFYIEKALKEGEVTFEWLHRRPDGELWDAKVQLLSFRSEEKILLQFSLIDITEQKKVEKELQKSELKYSTIFENAQVGIYQTTPEGEILQANPALIDMLGFDSFDEISKYNINIDNSYVNSTRKNFIKLIEEQGFVKDFESEWKTKGDETIIIKENSRVVRNLEGKTLYYEGFVENVTKRKLAEKALKESQNLFQTLAQVSPVGIFRTRTDGYTTYVNPKWMELSGLSFEEALGDGWLKAVHPDDREFQYNNWELHLKKSETSTAEYRFLKPDGSVVWVLGRAEPELVDNKICGYVGTITDITEVKKIENELKKHRDNLEILVKERTEELETTNEELIATNEEILKQREELETVLIDLKKAQNQLVHAEKMASLGILASGVAHEINNPLNFIRGGVFGIQDYIEDNLKNHLDELQTFIDIVNEGVDRATNIITSLNHYSRTNDLKKSICDMHKIIDNCLVILQNKIKYKIEIKKDYSDLPHSLLANEGRMHQVILNVLTNAVQSIENKGSISIKTLNVDDTLQILISDTGCGISNENISKIFDPFFTTKEVGAGTGLGLSITHNIIEEHNGTINVDSILGQGTTIKIVLPLNN